MYTGLSHLHSSIRYILLLLIVVSIVSAIQAFKNNTALGEKKFKLVKLSFILTHVQLLVGLILFFASPKVQAMLDDMSLVSANKELRFFGMEHPLQMVIAIALLTIGYIKAKKLSGVAQSKTIMIYWIIALSLIFISIPWPFLKDFGTWF